MAQITLNVPTIPKDWHSTAVGILGAVAVLLKQYAASGTFTLEGVAIAIFIAVVCYFIPAKPSVKDEAAMVATVTGIVDSTLGAKLPAILTAQQKVTALETSALEVATAVTDTANTTGAVQVN